MKLKNYIKYKFYDIYDIIRYDIWNFLMNIWKFRKELWNHTWWNNDSPISMLRRSLIIKEKGMHNGHEILESREKKIQKMQRVIQLLTNQINDDYIELAEKELNMKMILHEFKFVESDIVDKNNNKYYELLDEYTEEENKINNIIIDRSREIEESQWNEIWEILKGQPHQELQNLFQTKEAENNNTKIDDDKSSNIWLEWFDGSGLRTWWD